MELRGHHHAPVALPPGNNTDTYSVGGWMGHRAGLDFMENRKIFCRWGVYCTVFKSELLQ